VHKPVAVRAEALPVFERGHVTLVHVLHLYRVVMYLYACFAVFALILNHWICAAALTDQLPMQPAEFCLFSLS